MDSTEPLKKLVQAGDGAAEENRADYVTPFPIHDAHTGAIVLIQSTDLRIGADYSWFRGARAMIRGHLLEDTY